MIRRLRYRFILVATAALVVAVSLTLSAVLLLSSRRIDIQYGALLGAILDNGGRLPGRLPDPAGQTAPRHLHQGCFRESRYRFG